MQVQTSDKAKVLIPNAEHRNFTETNESIEANTILEGEPKVISGLRRGEPFQYRLFKTNNNQLIYLNKVRNMDATEVKLGADGDASPIKINLKQNILAKPAILGAISGAVVGFGYAKWKKHDLKKVGLYMLIGGVAGFAIGKIISHKAVIKTQK